MHLLQPMRTFVPLLVRPLLVSGMLATDEVGVCVVIDSEQDDVEKVKAFWHEVLHLFGLADEVQVERIALLLAEACPSVLRTLAPRINVVEPPQLNPTDDYKRLRWMIQQRINNMLHGMGGSMWTEHAAKAAQSELCDLLSAFDAGQPAPNYNGLLRAASNLLRRCLQHGLLRAEAEVLVREIESVTDDDTLDALLVDFEQQPPIDMLLFCPRCKTQHVDHAKGDWTNPPHATHTCATCGTLWRPSNANTNGVAALPVLEEKHEERMLACLLATCRCDVSNVLQCPQISRDADSYGCNACGVIVQVRP
jgi:hypothetical protein